MTEPRSLKLPELVEQVAEFCVDQLCNFDLEKPKQKA